MYRPSAQVDRTLANGRYMPPLRDYNAPVTGTKPMRHPADRQAPRRAVRIPIEVRR